MSQRGVRQELPRPRFGRRIFLAQKAYQLEVVRKSRLSLLGREDALKGVFLMHHASFITHCGGVSARFRQSDMSKIERLSVTSVVTYDFSPACAATSTAGRSTEPISA